MDVDGVLKDWAQITTNQHQPLLLPSWCESVSTAGLMLRGEEWEILMKQVEKVTLDRRFRIEFFMTFELVSFKAI